MCLGFSPNPTSITDIALLVTSTLIMALLHTCINSVVAGLSCIFLCEGCLIALPHFDSLFRFVSRLAITILLAMRFTIIRVSYYPQASDLLIVCWFFIRDVYVPEFLPLHRQITAASLADTRIALR